MAAPNHILPGTRILDDSGFDWSWAYVIFRPIAYAPGYLVSSDGRVFTCWQKRALGFPRGFVSEMSDEWAELKRTLTRDGYLDVTLSADGRRFCRRVNRLVLEIFVESCPPGMECLHRNGDPADNRLSNLCWGTPLENAADKRRHGTLVVGSRSPHAKLSEADVARIRELRAAGMLLKEIAEQFGVDPSRISHILAGRSWWHTDAHEPEPIRTGAMFRPRKLSEADVREMIRLRSNGVSCKDIARKFGVDSARVSRITRGLLWKHVWNSLGDQGNDSV